MTRRGQIEKLCEFRNRDGNRPDTEIGRHIEHRRLLPILTALLEENEKMRGALEKISNGGIPLGSPANNADRMLAMYDISRKILSASSPLDELLKETK